MPLARFSSNLTPFLSGLYRNVFFNEPKSRQMFELVCIYSDRFSSLIPITFLTGFYVSQVVNRWWDQFMSLPWPDRLALKLVSFCPGTVNCHTIDLIKGIYSSIFAFEICRPLLQRFPPSTYVEDMHCIKYKWARPCEKTGPKNQWFKPVISENKSLVRKKLITGLKKLTSGFWDLAKIS